MQGNGRDGHTRGYIIPIGGAEKKARDYVILERFVALAGGRDARLVVIPTASERESTGARYTRIFGRLGVRDVTVLPITQREQAFDERLLDAFDDATGAFLTGGNQLKLSTVLGGTPVETALRARVRAGMHVAGTSAGAAILSEHMIAGGAPGATPRAGGVALAPGLGFTRRLIIDQHFRQRDRLGRLLAALAYSPSAVGVGLDEDTALFLGPDGTFEVVGSGAVTVVDPSHLRHSSMHAAEPGEPVSVVGVTLHVLAHGGRFDTLTRVATPPPPRAVAEPAHRGRPARRL